MRPATLVILALAIACVAPPSHTALAASQQLPGGVPKFRTNTESPRTGRYIILFADGVDEGEVRSLTTALLKRHRGRGRHVYAKALRGFAADLSEADARALSMDSRVAFVEEDSPAYTASVQVNADWGLDRIDQRRTGTDGRYLFEADGLGVHLYILDSGVRTTHDEFTPRRATLDYTALADDGWGASDCTGHGTHVAAIAAGVSAGVAKRAFIHSVRVLPCGGSGWWSDVIAGIDWVTANHVKPAVANMSIGSREKLYGVQWAIQNAIAAGITFVVAAGNDNLDACQHTPGFVTDALVVGNFGRDEARFPNSNFGPCVDLFAPGDNIRSAYNSANASYAYMSGTSMAAPFVAGAAAAYLQRRPNATPSQVMSAVLGAATPGAVYNAGAGSPDTLLFTPPLTDGILPTVALTAPAAGDVVSGTVDVAAAASDNLALVRVDFYYGSTLFASDTTAPYTARWTTNTLADRDYALTAEATDIGGNVKRSSPRTVSVRNAATRRAFERIEAEAFDSMAGVTKNPTYIGYLDEGDWVKYGQVDFGAGAGAVSIRVAVPPDFAGRTIHLKVGSAGGSAIGSLKVSSTGSWSTFATQTTAITPVSGVQDLYLVFAGGTGVGNIDWFEFKAALSEAESLELPTTGWVASASTAYSSPARAIDRSSDSKWQNGRSQLSSNDYLQVDLGTATTFDRLLLDHTGALDDFPVSYRVDVSDDGQAWTTVRTGAGARGTTDIAFTAVTRRFVRVTETGTTGSKWFTVNELKLFGPAARQTGELPVDGWRAAASHSYAPAGRAIDRNALYKWQNGRSQATSNDYIQVDLGVATTFRRVVLEHTGNEGDFPVSYRVDVSDDGVSWQLAHTGSGTRGQTTIALAVPHTKRYIRVTETGTTGAQWFSVNEVRLFDF